MKTLHWQFVLHVGSVRRWTWQRMRMDGTIERISASQPEFDKAVIDALRNGFRPKADHWVVLSAENYTHFAPRQPLVTIPPDYNPVLPPANMSQFNRPKRRRWSNLATGKAG